MQTQLKEKIIVPTIIVIFGATGDLSSKKLIPALFDLFQKGKLPDVFKIIGFSRRTLSDEEYQRSVKTTLEGKVTGFSHETLEKFLAHISYTHGAFDEKESYVGLREVLAREEIAFNQCANKLFYLAVPPLYYKNIFQELSDSGLTIPCSDQTGWTRILVEKPFGNDMQTAEELDRMLGRLFQEDQIFRIDHYLAKEALQDVLMFRFSNMLFEPLWNRNYIERVEISMLGKGGLEKRGAFYDSVGALRDVGQNHILQMLAYVAMEDPVEYESNRVHPARAEVLKALRPITKEAITSSVMRAQYAEYRDIPNVARDSQTETYFRINAFIDNERWRDVPFVLESGQALDEEKTEIKIYFKKTTTCLCPPGAEHYHQNMLTFRIQPNEGISVLFWAKKPGLTLELEPKELSFSYRSSADASLFADAYEKVLFDAIAGDQMLFASTKEVLYAWKFIMSVLESWESVPLLSYPKGTSPQQNIL